MTCAGSANAGNVNPAGSLQLVVQNNTVAVSWIIGDSVLACLTFSLLLGILRYSHNVAHPMKTLLRFLAIVSLVPGFALSLAKFYNYYREGLRYIEQKDWQRAITELSCAASLEFEDSEQKRIYGTRFIEYFRHREMGRAYYHLVEVDNARKELELSYAYEQDSETEQLLSLVKTGAPVAATQPPVSTPSQPAAQKPLEASPSVLPPGALTYDPSRVTQVGTRLALAVLPFTSNQNAQQLAEMATDKMVTRLVNLRRFKVIDRAALDKVLAEQSLQLSGVVDEKQAVNVGKIAGADAIVLGSVTVIKGRTTVGARVIDTETSETILAKDEQGNSADLVEVEDSILSNLESSKISNLNLISPSITLAFMLFS